MDPELKAYLDGMRQDLMAHAEQLKQDTRRDLMAHAEQLNQDTRRDLMAHAEQLNQDTRRDLMAHAEQLNRETGVLVEDLHHQIQLLAEGVTTVRDQLGRIIADHETRITRLERRMP